MGNKLLLPHQKTSPLVFLIDVNVRSVFPSTNSYRAGVDIGVVIPSSRDLAELKGWLARVTVLAFNLVCKKSPASKFPCSVHRGEGGG